MSGERPSGAPALLGDHALVERLKQRARVLEGLRGYFAEQNFLEVDTPLLTRETSTDVHVEPLRVGDRYLITSPELSMKRLLCAGASRIYQISSCFRAGESGPWHTPEFTLVEWYRAHQGSSAVQQDTERLLLNLCRRLRGTDHLELAGGRRVELTPPFERLSVREAFRRFAGVPDAVALANDDEDRYFQLLVDRVEPALAGFERPVFLHDYPSSQAALARRQPNDPSVADRFELYVGGLELCNGYGELTDADEQRARFQRDRARRRALGLTVPSLPEHFLRALERGMPPAGGNALGLDRLIALLVGATSLAGAVGLSLTEV